MDACMIALIWIWGGVNSTLLYISYTLESKHIWEQNSVQTAKVYETARFCNGRYGRVSVMRRKIRKLAKSLSNILRFF